ncbi:VOC family protein [Nocardioides sp. LHD-245]|uniref:VOC family protein n=1 Tax=Nocardioides sp. LHD-245 TaxID=3051387 RepID=UPI0027E112B4|nr:VOC family protein [Nocardioides sp. LHD-245]
MLTSLNHIGFSVADLDRSVEFYTKLFGYPPYFNEVYDVEYVGRIVGYPGAVQHAAFFRLPGEQGLFLELIQYLHPKPEVVAMESYNAGIAHLCLQVDDLEAEFERISAIGGRFRSESVVQSDYGIYEGARSAYFRDPDDISIQLVELVDGIDPGLEA